MLDIEVPKRGVRGQREQGGRGVRGGGRGSVRNSVLITKFPVPGHEVNKQNSAFSPHMLVPSVHTSIW
jgi:hypothetical protein